MLDRVVSRNQIANSRMIPRETAGLEMRRDAGSLGARHAVDEDDDVRRDMRLAWPPRARLATPEKSESLPMPSQQRLGLDQQQGMPPLTVEAREQHEQASLVDAKGRAFDGARCDNELLPKKRVSVISSARDRVRSAMKPLATPEGRRASRSALIARAARSATVAASWEPGTRSTARSERIRGQSSTLVRQRLLRDRATEEGSRHSRHECVRGALRGNAPPRAT
jgi:hypothetical protein